MGVIFRKSKEHGIKPIHNIEAGTLVESIRTGLLFLAFGVAESDEVVFLDSDGQIWGQAQMIGSWCDDEGCVRVKSYEATLEVIY